MLINSVGIRLGTQETMKTGKNPSKELKEKFTLLKDELGEKIKNNDTEPTFLIGNNAFTINEWKDFLQNFDKQEEDIKEEIEEEIENREEKANEEETIAELLGDRTNYLMKGNETVPYQYLVKNGVIEYNGVTFVADSERNELLLGDCSDRSKCITVYLKNGGKLIANAENFDDLSKAISMFCPEDIKRILCAMADYNKIQSAQQEIEDDHNKVFNFSRTPSSQ